MAAKGKPLSAAAAARGAALLAEALDHHRAGRLAEAQALYLKLLKLAPGEAELHFNLGLALMQSGRAGPAAERWKKAVALDPGHVRAWTNLGIAQAALGDAAAAAASLRRSLRLAPDLPESHSNLSIVLGQLGAPEEGETHARRALALNPAYAEAANSLGILLLQQARHDEAEAAFRQAIALNPGFAQAHFNLSLVLLAQGRLAEGWAEREWRLAGGVDGAGARCFPQPAWTGEDLAGKTIVLYGEQGFGDSLQFVRFAEAVARRGARVVLEVPRPLARLLAGAPGVAAVVAAGDPWPPCDYRQSLMSLPGLLGVSLDSIPAPVPYLKAAPEAAAAWRQRLAALPGRKVGLVWSGDPRPHDPLAAATDRRRSMALDQLAPLLEVPGCSFVSLQKGPAAAALRRLPAARRPLEVMDGVGDFADSAALVTALDLVITVDTAVAHLAGALGRPVWILSRFDGCWRWLLQRDDSPWYPTARLFRQQRAGDWAGVVARVASQLSSMADMHECGENETKA
ncbi:photosystem I assembly protein Ycf3 [mine drainage metagenome]|uniref:Photosystem I assembly protein Ycf3 n=1 Tax=mine drainage metagenome TaxID=410659 RepID=A0A1J5T268_9ZZZZ